MNPSESERIEISSQTHDVTTKPAGPSGGEDDARPQLMELQRALDRINSAYTFATVAGDDADRLVLAGQFSLEQLKHIIEAWEQFNGAT